MADSTATKPEVAAPGATEQTAVAEPVAAPAGGEAVESKPTDGAAKEPEKSEGAFYSITRPLRDGRAHRRG